MLRSLSATVLALVVLASTATTTFGSDLTHQVQITARPGELGARVSPSPVIPTTNERPEGMVRVDNTSHLLERVELRVADYMLDPSGKPVPAPADYPYGSARWYEFEATSFTLEPGTGREIEFRTAAPPNAAAGDYFAALSVAVSAEQPAAESGSALRSSLVFENRMQHRILGALPRSPELTLTAENSWDGVTFDAMVRNSGNTLLAYQFPPLPQVVVVEAAPWSVGATHALSATGFYVPPHSGRTVRVTWADPPLLAWGTATLTLPGVDDLPASTVAIDVIVVNYRLAAVLAAITFVIAVCLLLVRRRRQAGPR
jgi:hypothetical protein